MLLVQEGFTKNDNTHDRKFEYIQYLNDQRKFVSQLDKKPRQKLTVRLFNVNYQSKEWCDELRWTDYDKNIKIEMLGGDTSSVLWNDKAYNADLHLTNKSNQVWPGGGGKQGHSIKIAFDAPWEMDGPWSDLKRKNGAGHEGTKFELQNFDWSPEVKKGARPSRNRRPLSPMVSRWS